MNLPSYITVLLDRLSECGFSGYPVGGCVRDFLLGKIPGDYDLTTDATPQEMLSVFSSWRCIETGLRHGTVTVVSEGNNVEITAFRCDGEYKDNRHPTEVTFTRSIADDLSRRDFTVNAMAFDRNEGIIDLFGGREDLQNKIIRCVGEPDRRFNEDALRIMRALRFAATLDFEIEEKTADSIHRNVGLLNNISAERIFVELKKLLCGAAAERILLQFADVFCCIIPELQPIVGLVQHNPHHLYDVYTHTAKAVALCEADPVLRLAALFHDLGKADTFSFDENGIGHFYNHRAFSVQKADAALRRLKSDNATRRTVLFLVDWHDRLFGDFSEKTVKRLLRTQTAEELLLLAKLMRADSEATGTRMHETCESADRLEEIVLRLQAEQPCLSVTDLAVNGHDLLALGYEPKTIGNTLKHLLEAVTDGKIENNKEDLLAVLRK